MSNVTVPLKFLTSLLFGFRYLTKQERANEKLLLEAWNDLDSSFVSSSSSNVSSSVATPRGKVRGLGRGGSKSRTWGLIKRGRILGLSKMLIKSLIFAVAGIVAMIVFRFIKKRKAL